MNGFVCPSSPLAYRVLDAFPAGNYALPSLLQLLDIVESREVDTAAVECKVQPRMLMNPDLIDKWANTPERLLMLVLHELHHVLLGHTRLAFSQRTVQHRKSRLLQNPRCQE